MTKDPDQILIQKILDGDKEAFEWLFLKYHRRIGHVLSSVLVHPADIEDALQETFLRAYRALPKFQGRSQFYTWLHRIAVNCARSVNARRLRQCELPLNTPEEDPAATAPALQDPETPETALQRREIIDAVKEAIAQLPADQRRTILLREIEGLSYDEIAQAMDCPPGTVRSRLYRAREQVAKTLSETFEVFSSDQFK